MNSLYTVNSDGTSDPLTRVRCSDETKELQDILEKNLDLIPGDQINPEDPRRWICVKRELPIEDPTTGDNRWSCDFLLPDQSGIPTLVECKRFMDTRSRREVVGQMFDYAANGSHYFSRDVVTEYLAEEASRRGSSIEGLLQSLSPDSGESLDEFLDLVENNIKQGQVRLVFFMEEARPELRSIVEFLNSQLERTEMLIVEAKQFQSGTQRFVSPSLWGYTEQARTIKKSVTVTARSGSRKRWDQESFLSAVKDSCSAEVSGAIVGVFQKAVSTEGLEVGWGSGAKIGSYQIFARSVCERSFLIVSSDGVLTFPLQWINQTDQQLALRDFIFDFLNSRTSLSVPEDKKKGNANFKDWQSQLPKLLELLSEIQARFLSHA